MMNVCSTINVNVIYSNYVNFLGFCGKFINISGGFINICGQFINSSSVIAIFYR